MDPNCIFETRADISVGCDVSFSLPGMEKKVDLEFILGSVQNFDNFIG